MSNSDYQGEESRLRQLLRQTSDQLKSRASPHPNMSQSGHHEAQAYNQSELFINPDQKNNSDVRSLIENLMKTKDMRVSPDFAYMSSKPVLVRAEEKIFQQVVNLLIEINEIKENISKQQQSTIKLEAERDLLLNKPSVKGRPVKKVGDIEMDSIINNLRSKEGDEHRVSISQLEKIALENENLEMNINRMKIKKNGNVKQMLEKEKRRYKALKAQLEEKKAELDYQILSEHESQDLLLQIKKVQADIERLKGQGRQSPNIQFEIKLLGEQNQKLRDKTVRILQQSNDYQSREDEEERRRLEEYIRQEEENKILFMEDLKKFKAEYNQLLHENARLKNHLKNNAVVVMGDERYDRNDARFYQYKDLVSEMQSVMK